MITDKQPQQVYVPCDEHDENCSGGYTSYDGQSLCHVSEQQYYLLSTEEMEAVRKCVEENEKLINWVEKLKPDYDHKDSYQHGFFDALEMVKDKLSSLIK